MCKDSRVHLCWRLGWESSMQTSVQFIECLVSMACSATAYKNCHGY